MEFVKNLFSILLRSKLGSVVVETKRVKTRRINLSIKKVVSFLFQLTIVYSLFGVAVWDPIGNFCVGRVNYFLHGLINLDPIRKFCTESST